MGAAPASAEIPNLGYAMVKGTIVKESGNRLANAKVVVGISDCESPDGCGVDSVVTVRTDAEGHYHARVGVTENKNVTVSVSEKGPYLGRTSVSFPIAVGRTVTKNLTLYKKSLIIGTLRDASGAPIDGLVRVFDATTNELVGADAPFAVNGSTFHILLRGGKYIVKLYVDTSSGRGGVVTQWFQGAKKANATVITVAPGTAVRIAPIFTP